MGELACGQPVNRHDVEEGPSERTRPSHLAEQQRVAVTDAVHDASTAEPRERSPRAGPEEGGSSTSISAAPGPDGTVERRMEHGEPDQSSTERPGESPRPPGWMDLAVGTEHVRGVVEAEHRTALER